MGDFRSVSTCTRFGRFDSIFPAARGDDFNSRFARLAVLYEDLSIEANGMTAPNASLPTLERHSCQYRKQYFARRAIGTLCEFTEAVRALNRTPHFDSVLRDFHPDQTEAWRDAERFFSENESMIQKIRNDVGGHFG